MFVAAGREMLLGPAWRHQVGSLGDEVEGGPFSQVLVLGAKQPYSPDRRSRGQSPEISLWGAWRGCTGSRRPRARG